MNKHSKAFTLTEIMLVVIIMGIIAAFAMPNYTRSLERAYARDAVVQLTALQSANNIYKAHAGQYLCGQNILLAQINSNLGINIIPSTSDITYLYSSGNGGSCVSPNPTAFNATARYIRGGTDYTIRVNETNIQSTAPANPCCSAGCGALTTPPAC